VAGASTGNIEAQKHEKAETIFESFFKNILNIIKSAGDLLNRTTEKIISRLPIEKAEAQTGWWNSNWLYRQKIIFNNSSSSENLDNFPVLVKLNSSRVNYNQTQNSGQDIRLVDADGATLLAHEIEKWDESGDSYVWVKVPRIDASSNTDHIWLYYGNPSAPDGQNKTAVWDANYVGVWHLHNDFLDSTLNDNDGSNNGSDDVLGKIADGQNFNGTSDYINVGNKPSLRLTGAMTVEAWGVLDTVENRRLVAKQGGDYNRSWSLNTERDDGKYHFMISSDGVEGHGVTSNSAISIGTNTWSYWAGVYVPSMALKIYVNGNLDNSNTAGIPSSQYNNNLDVWIGARNECGNCWWDGKIDEVRISKTARSSDWLAAQYKSMSDTLNTYASSLGVTLTATDSQGRVGVKTKTIDLASGPSCSDTSFNFNSVLPLGSSQLALNWDTAAAATSYTIYRNGSPLANPSYSCAASSCSYTDTGLLPGTQYSYYIIAQPSATKNSTSNPACDGAVSTCSLSASTGNVVTGLNVSSNTCGLIRVVWDNLGDDYSYHIYKDITNVNNVGSGDEIMAASYTCGAGDCTFNDSEIIPGEIYYYKVTSESEGVESELSSAPTGYAHSYCYRAPTWEER